jgi:hypothetical protein
MGKIRTDTLAAMMGSKLNAHWQVIIRDLQNMHEKPLPPTGARRRMEYQDRARLQGRGPHTGGPKGPGRLVGWRMW